MPPLGENSAPSTYTKAALSLGITYEGKPMGMVEGKVRLKDSDEVEKGGTMSQSRKQVGKEAGRCEDTPWRSMGASLGMCCFECQAEF